MSFACLGCHQYHNSMNGYIQSPNFPSYYPNNANCSYLISSPDPLARIVLTRVQFNLESHSYCRYDSVKIYNGWTSSAPRVGPSHGYCGNTFPLTCISTGNAMFITFTSDGSVSRSGFKLHYRGTLVFFIMLLAEREKLNLFYFPNSMEITSLKRLSLKCQEIHQFTIWHFGARFSWLNFSDVKMFCTHIPCREGGGGGGW